MRWKWTKRIYMWYLHIRRRRHFNDVIFLFCCENTMGDMLILIIKFGAFRLKLASKMQEGPGPRITMPP